jgi:hypothetical protein
LFNRPSRVSILSLFLPADGSKASFWNVADIFLLQAMDSEQGISYIIVLCCILSYISLFSVYVPSLNKSYQFEIMIKTGDFDTKLLGECE